MTRPPDAFEERDRRKLTTVVVLNLTDNLTDVIWTDFTQQQVRELDHVTVLKSVLNYRLWVNARRNRQSFVSQLSARSLIGGMELQTRNVNLEIKGLVEIVKTSS